MAHAGVSDYGTHVMYIGDTLLDKLSKGKERKSVELLNFGSLTGTEKIRRIENLNEFEGLTVLKLKNHEISKLEHLTKLQNLVELDVSGNRIARIEGLSKLHRLERLVLSFNLIEKIPVKEMRELTRLRELTLNGNRITELESVSGLQYNVNLFKLDLRDNRICDLPHYRQFVIFALRTVKYLDECEVMEAELYRAKEKFDTAELSHLQEELARMNEALDTLKAENHSAVADSRALAAERDTLAVKYRDKKKEIEELRNARKSLEEAYSIQHYRLIDADSTLAQVREEHELLKVGTIFFLKELENYFHGLGMPAFQSTHNVQHMLEHWKNILAELRTTNTVSDWIHPPLDGRRVRPAKHGGREPSHFSDISYASQPSLELPNPTLSTIDRDSLPLGPLTDIDESDCPRGEAPTEGKAAHTDQGVYLRDDDFLLGCGVGGSDGQPYEPSDNGTGVHINPGDISVGGEGSAGEHRDGYPYTVARNPAIGQTDPETEESCPGTGLLGESHGLGGQSFPGYTTGSGGEVRPSGGTNTREDSQDCDGHGRFPHFNSCKSESLKLSRDGSNRDDSWTRARVSPAHPPHIGYGQTGADSYKGWYTDDYDSQFNIDGQTARYNEHQSHNYNAVDRDDSFHDPEYCNPGQSYSGIIDRSNGYYDYGLPQSLPGEKENDTLRGPSPPRGIPRGRARTHSSANHRGGLLRERSDEQSREAWPDADESAVLESLSRRIRETGISTSHCLPNVGPLPPLEDSTSLEDVLGEETPCRADASQSSPIGNIWGTPRKADIMSEFLKSRKKRGAREPRSMNTSMDSEGLGSIPTTVSDTAYTNFTDNSCHVATSSALARNLVELLHSREYSHGSLDTARGLSKVKTNPETSFDRQVSFASSSAPAFDGQDRSSNDEPGLASVMQAYVIHSTVQHERRRVYLDLVSEEGQCRHALSAREARRRTSLLERFLQALQVATRTLHHQHQSLRSSLHELQKRHSRIDRSFDEIQWNVIRTVDKLSAPASLISRSSSTATDAFTAEYAPIIVHRVAAPDTSQSSSDNIPRGPGTAPGTVTFPFGISRGSSAPTTPPATRTVAVHRAVDSCSPASGGGSLQTSLLQTPPRSPPADRACLLGGTPRRALALDPSQLVAVAAPHTPAGSQAHHHHYIHLHQISSAPGAQKKAFQL